MDNSNKLIYVASPYSHDNPDVILRRFNQVCYIAGNMIADGLLVYCPIAHSHPIAKQGLADDWETWQKLDLAMLAKCDELWIATMQGWRQSKGIKAEVRFAKSLKLPIRHVPKKYMEM